jgi:hypothetical protein
METCDLRISVLHAGMDEAFSHVVIMIKIITASMINMCLKGEIAVGSINITSPFEPHKLSSVGAMVQRFGNYSLRI